MLLFLAGVLVGLVFGFWVGRDDGPKAELAHARMQEAFNHAAKLSRIIHRQRIVIGVLKAQLPKKPTLSAAGKAN